MTVEELIELLEEQNPAAEVRFAWQRSWPMESTLVDRVVEFGDHEQGADGLIYLAEAEHLGYLPGQVAEELGWR